MRVRSRADLIKGINLPARKFFCAKCHGAIPKEEKIFYKGFCHECASLIITEHRCTVCFEKITGVASRDMTLDKTCCSCGHGYSIGSNICGTKEGEGKSYSGNKTNFRTDNYNDDLAKIYEK